MLLFKHIILLSKIFDKIDGKSYFEYLERKLQKVEDNYKIKNNIDDNKKLQEIKAKTATFDICSFIFSKMHIVEKDLIDFFIATKKMEKNEIEQLTAKEIWNMLKQMFSDTMPTFIKDKLSDGLKKTLLQKE